MRTKSYLRYEPTWQPQGLIKEALWCIMFSILNKKDSRLCNAGCDAFTPFKGFSVSRASKDVVYLCYLALQPNCHGQ